MITLICGPMFSGKSTSLVQKMERYFYAKKRIAYVKPLTDNRGYVTHSGLSSVEERFGKDVSCFEVGDLSTIVDTLTNGNYDAVFIDEYFMISNCESICATVTEKGKHLDIYFAGLLADSDAKIWPEAEAILPYCDEVIKLNGVCTDCGSQHANYSYYKAGTKKDRLTVGDNAYTCLCRRCFLQRRLTKV